MDHDEAQYCVNASSKRHDSLSMQDWDPRSMLNNMGFLEQKIHQLKELVHIIVDHRSLVGIQGSVLSVQQQQLITSDLTSIILQLISTAGRLLPTVKYPSVNVEDQPNHVEHEAEDENLPPGSYEILQLEKEEILAPHAHFCAICGKGFKRDANLRMHMRGHGNEYRTPGALAKPHKTEPRLIKRYSCPCVGCKRNKEHKKFQPLKTILSVKNHYKRSHCEKSYACSRCNMKKFSVLADLRTHEKHCGTDKWVCSCGTTFSRKDKLFGHISLFQGHTPAIPHLGFCNEGQTTVQGRTGNPINLEEFPPPPFPEDTQNLFSLMLSQSWENSSEFGSM